MAKMLKINDDVAGVKRPFRLEDLQNVWDALRSVCARNGEAAIISGFEKLANNTWGSGVLYHQGVLYLYDASETPASVGGNLYLYRLDDSQREFADGTVRPFYNNYVIRGAQSLGTAYAVLSATEEKVAQWKSNPIADGSITTDKLADNAITALKIADRAISRHAQMSQNVVALRNLAHGAQPCIVSGSSFDAANVTINDATVQISITPTILPEWYAGYFVPYQTKRVNLTRLGSGNTLKIESLLTGDSDVTNPYSSNPLNAPNQISVFFDFSNAYVGDGNLSIVVGTPNVGFSTIVVNLNNTKRLLLNLIKVEYNGTWCYQIANTPISPL